MEVRQCMTPDYLAYFLAKGRHEVLSYDPNIITTIADRVYVFMLDTRYMLWCEVIISTAT